MFATGYCDLLACDAIIALLPWCLYICLSGTGMHVIMWCTLTQI